MANWTIMSRGGYADSIPAPSQLDLCTQIPLSQTPFCPPVAIPLHYSVLELQ